AEARAERRETCQERGAIVSRREEEVAEKDRERPVEVEVVVLEERSETRGDDHPPQRCRVLAHGPALKPRNAVVRKCASRRSRSSSSGQRRRPRSARCALPD